VPSSGRVGNDRAESPIRIQIDEVDRPHLCGEARNHAHRGNSVLAFAEVTDLPAKPVGTLADEIRDQE